MRTNIFKVKEKDERRKRIVIEEEKTKNPFLLFFRRHRMVFLLIIGTIIILSLLVSVGFAFSILRGSNDYDISYVEGGDKINSNNDPSIKDEDIKKDLLGEESRGIGIVVLVKTVMSSSGDVISYYTDGTAIIVGANGKTYRVFPLKNGNYGVDDNGKVNSNATKIYVESTTTTLSDGTIITYYTDGTAKVELKGETIFVRDSNNVKMDNGSTFVSAAPSGVSLTKNISKGNAGSFIEFTDKSTYVSLDNTKYIVNRNKEVSMRDGNISFDKNNSFGILGEKTYKDGNTITVFENGAAIIKDKKGNVIYVKKSGDILLKSKSLYEISPNDYGYSMSTVRCGDGKNVIYYDNGSAIITYPDGSREYVSDSDTILYDNQKNIVSNPDGSIKVSEKITVDGDKVYNFSNGKSQVIEADGSSYVVDTDKLTFKSTGEIDDSKNNNPSHGSGVKPGEGLIIREVENKFDDEFKNINSTTMIIKNNNREKKLLRITIQEVSNYRKYNTFRLDPQFVLFQATIGTSYVPRTSLTNHTWVDSDGNTNYVIYEGNVNASDSVLVKLSLYVDYANLDNRYQNKGFIGTIKVYVDDEDV